MSSDPQHRGIIPWFAGNPVAANLLMLLVIALGAISVGSLNKKSFPTLPPNGIDVSVSYDSGSAKASEESIAIPIEQKLQGVEGIKNTMSSSRASGAGVNIEVKDGYDLDEVYTSIKEEIGEMTFPSEADPASITKDTRSELAIIIQMFGDTDRRTLQKLAYDLKTDLLTDQQINSVSISGALDLIMEISVDKNKLDAYGLTLTEVSTAINAESSTAKVATLSNRDIYLTISASEQDYFKSQFASIPIKSFSNGGQLLLGEIASIKDTFDDSDFVLSRFNQKNSLALRINTIGQDDIINTVEATKKVVDKWQNSNRLPPSVELVTWNDRSTSINQRLELMVKNALTGVFLVFVLLAVFLNITVAFWVAMGLPFIFFGTLFAMGSELTGLSLNLITTFGFILALGIVVDDAVVVGESIYDVRSKDGDTLGNTIKGTMNVAVPTLFGVFTTVAAFWALSNIDGRLGQIYSQFAIVVAICLILSVVESKIILPAHLSHINTRKSAPKNILSKVWHYIQHGANSGLSFFSNVVYRPTIQFALTHRYAMLIGFISIFSLVMSMPFTGEIRTSFFPRIPGDTVRASLTMYSDVSYGQTQKALLEIEHKAYEADALLISSGKGQPEKSGIKNIETRAKGDQDGDFRIELRSDAPYTPRQFSAKWQQLAGTPEGVKSLRIRSAAETVDALYIEITSSDSSALDGAMDTLISALNQLPAVTGIEKFDAPLEDRLALELNEQGRLLGLSTQNLATQITTNFDGDTVQKYQRDNDEIKVKLGYVNNQQSTANDILSTQITLDSGTNIPLETVASFAKTEVQTNIIRIDGKRSYYLSAEVDKDILSSTEVVEFLQKNIMPNIEKQFSSVTFDFGGEAEEQAETESSLLDMFLLALLIIYALLAIPLKSYTQPAIIMMAIPFGIIGALLGHWMNDLSISIFSLNGIIALSGVVVNDSLLLVSRFNTLRKETMHVKKAIILACQGRLRAVLLTSFTTFAGLIPILWETSRQAQALIPAAVSLGYGIMFATFITLVLIPVLLLIQEDFHLVWIKITKRTTKETSDIVS
ncbi:MMPL family transporter [Marinomonas mediterranea]|uniref:efflux RND transporter permease subunit n=1 Tax=Marinomonas mediterranea TaxID=119864 RepID=UPI00234B92CF|nr:efflux RND transporter permease subunit [Marinomonas mediterranea]WCN13063.1 MMPL family transporter [Marinomonas mediterranea]